MSDAFFHEAPRLTLKRRLLFAVSIGGFEVLRIVLLALLWLPVRIMPFVLFIGILSAAMMSYICVRRGQPLGVLAQIVFVLGLGCLAYFLPRWQMWWRTARCPWV